MRRLTGVLIAGVLALAPAAVSAQSISVGAAVGTQGGGLEVGLDFSDMFTVRAVGNYFKISRGVDGEDVEYDGDLRLMTYGLLADVYPFDTGFHLTGGAYLNRNDIDFTATPTGNVEVGGTAYTPAMIGNLTGNAKYKDFAPYAGVGYTGNRGNRGWSFTADAGVMYQGGSKVTLAATGPATALPGFAADLERERRDIKDDIDNLKFYPVLKIGVAYRF